MIEKEDCRQRSSSFDPLSSILTMKCPFCHETENRVIDSRLSKDSNMIRRRRECEALQWALYDL